MTQLYLARGEEERRLFVCLWEDGWMVGWWIGVSGKDADAVGVFAGWWRHG